MALPFRYNVLSLLARPTSTFTSIALVALIIATFSYLQAVTDSALQTMAGTGDPNTIIVLNRASASETVSGFGREMVNKLELVPGVIREGDAAIISPETVAISSARVTADSEVTSNTSVRGVDFDLANRVRHGRVKIVEGRVFEPGTEEVIVGISAHKTYYQYGIGDMIEAGTRGKRLFKIVGIFSAAGSAAESEVWGYVETMRDVYARDGYSSARLLVGSEQAGLEAVDYITGPVVELEAMTEKDYFENLGTNQRVTEILSIVMIVIMGTAAAFAVANTMYSAVAGRTREIGMLKAVGFASSSVLTSFVIEGLIIAMLGGVIGCGLSYLCDGMQRSILPTTFTTVTYTLKIDAKIIGVSLAVALVIGLAGSIMPAWRAARLPVTRALRES